MSRTPRAHPHNACKQPSCERHRTDDNPILQWIAHEVPRCPEVYLRHLQRQTALLQSSFSSSSLSQATEELLAAVLLNEFAVSHGLSVGETLCLMPAAARSAGDAIRQLQVWISAIPAH